MSALQISLGTRLGAYYFLYYAILGVFLPFWPRYLSNLGFDSVEIGILIGIIGISKILAPNVWAYWSDRTGRLVGVIKLGSLLTLLSFVGVMHSNTFNANLLSFTLFCFCWNSMMPQLEALTLEYSEKHAGLYSKIRMWGSVGFIFSAMLLGFLIDYASIQVVPQAIVVLATGLLIVSLSIVPVNRHPSDSATHPEATSFISLLFNQQLLIFLCVYFLLQLSHAPYYTFFDLYMVQQGASSKLVGSFISLGVFAEIFIFFYAGRLISQFDWKKLLILCLLLSCTRWLLLGLFSEFFVLVAFSQLLHALSFGLTHAIAVFWIFQHFPAHKKSQGQALYASCTWGLGGASGSFLAGLTWSEGNGATFTFFWAAASCLLATVLVYRFLSSKSTIGNQVKSKSS